MDGKFVLNTRRNSIFLALIAAFLLGAPAASATETTSAKTTSAKTEATSGKSRAWHGRLDDAVAEARQHDRYIIIDMWAEWCGWCRELDRTVFQSAEFQKFAEDFVLLRVDTMDKGEGSTLQMAYNVEKLPTTVVINADRIRVGSLPGMFEPDEFIVKLGQEIGKYERFVEFYDKVKDSDKLEIQRQLAKELHERGDGLRAAGLYETIGASVPERSPEKAQLLFHTADAFRIGGNHDRARFYALKSRDTASGLGLSELAEKAHMLGYYIARNEGDCEAAQSTLTSFLERFPESEQRFEVRRSLRELRRGEVADCR